MDTLYVFTKNNIHLEENDIFNESNDIGDMYSYYHNRIMECVKYISLNGNSQLNN